MSLPWLENQFSIVLRQKRIENLNATGRSQMNRSSYPLKEWQWWGTNTCSCSLGVIEAKGRFRSNHHLCVPSSDQNKITCQLSCVTISIKRNCVFEVPSTLFRGGGGRNRSVVCGNCIIMDKEHLTFPWEPLYHPSVCDS